MTPTLDLAALEAIKAAVDAASDGEWSKDALYCLLRFARKNEGPWDEVDVDRVLPREESAAAIVLLRANAPALLRLARLAFDAADQAERDAAKIERYEKALLEIENGGPKGNMSDLLRLVHLTRIASAALKGQP